MAELISKQTSEACSRLVLCLVIDGLSRLANAAERLAAITDPSEMEGELRRLLDEVKQGIRERHCCVANLLEAAIEKAVAVVPEHILAGVAVN